MQLNVTSAKPDDGKLHVTSQGLPPTRNKDKTGPRPETGPLVTPQGSLGAASHFESSCSFPKLLPIPQNNFCLELLPYLHCAKAESEKDTEVALKRHAREWQCVPKGPQPCADHKIALLRIPTPS